MDKENLTKAILIDDQIYVKKSDQVYVKMKDLTDWDELHKIDNHMNANPSNDYFDVE